MGASDDDTILAITEGARQALHMEGYQIEEAVTAGVEQALAPPLSEELLFRAVREGVEAAVYRVLTSGSDDPGDDLRQAVKDGAAEGFLRMFPDGIPMDPEP